jgi:hypothetical protein
MNSWCCSPVEMDWAKPRFRRVSENVAAVFWGLSWQEQPGGRTYGDKICSIRDDGCVLRCIMGGRSRAQGPIVPHESAHISRDETVNGGGLGVCVCGPFRRACGVEDRAMRSANCRQDSGVGRGDLAFVRRHEAYITSRVRGDSRTGDEGNIPKDTENDPWKRTHSCD